MHKHEDAQQATGDCTTLTPRQAVAKIRGVIQELDLVHDILLNLVEQSAPADSVDAFLSALDRLSKVSRNVAGGVLALARMITDAEIKVAQAQAEAPCREWEHFTNGMACGLMGTAQDLDELRALMAPFPEVVKEALEKALVRLEAESIKRER